MLNGMYDVFATFRQSDDSHIAIVANETFVQINAYYETIET